MIEPEEIESKLNASLTDAHISVIDMTGTKDHYKVVVVTPDFEGKLPIKRHRMIYGALGEEMKGAIHALTIEAYTPQQWAERQ